MKCNNCGAPLTGSVCEYCGSSALNSEGKQKTQGNSASSASTTFVAGKKKTCPHCKAMVSSDAKICGHCGKTLPNRSSTVIGCAVLVVILSFSLGLLATIVDAIASVVNNNSQEDSHQEIIIDYYNSDSVENADGDEEPVDVGDVNITITKVEKISTSSSSFWRPAPGNEFVAIRFLVENTSDEDIYFVSSDIEAYLDDVKQSYSTNAWLALSLGADGMGGSVAPGKKLELVYTLELPEGWNSIELIADLGINRKKATFVVNNQ